MQEKLIFEWVRELFPNKIFESAVSNKSYALYYMLKVTIDIPFYCLYPTDFGSQYQLCPILLGLLQKTKQIIQRFIQKRTRNLHKCILLLAKLERRGSESASKLKGKQDQKQTYQKPKNFLISNILSFTFYSNVMLNLNLKFQTLSWILSVPLSFSTSAVHFTKQYFNFNSRKLNMFTSANTFVIFNVQNISFVSQYCSLCQKYNNT